MTLINKQRLSAEIEGDFVVFLIGMRVNRLFKPHKWLPVFTAMPRMIAELQNNADSGFLGAENGFFSPRMPFVLQYWRSFEDLERYARDRDAKHYPAWVAFNKRVASNGDVGIWHETYAVRAGEYETIYNNMPAFGLVKVSSSAGASGVRESAAGRMGKAERGEGVPTS